MHDIDIEHTHTEMFRVDPKETSSEKRTPMRIAAENNNDEIVEILAKTIGEGIPDDVKLLQLSRVMSGPQSGLRPVAVWGDQSMVVRAWAGGGGGVIRHP